jgi:hypothetical protein
VRKLEIRSDTQDEDLEEELSDLNLLHYCPPFMKRKDELG